MMSKNNALVLVFSLAASFLIWATPNTAEAFLFEVGAGLKGGLNGSAGSAIPKDGRIQDQQGGTHYVGDPQYYGHFGFGSAFGPVLELRALGFLGLETGFYVSRDNAEGSLTLNTSQGSTRIVSEQETTAYHIPLLLRANLPGSLIRPFLGVGFEFVRQSSSTIEYREEPGTERLRPSDLEHLQHRNQIAPSNYTLFLVSTGMEIKFGPLRVPIEVRGGYNLGFDENLEARATYNTETGQITYNGAYEGHFGIFTGVIYDFDFLF